MCVCRYVYADMCILFFSTSAKDSLRKLGDFSRLFLLGCTTLDKAFKVFVGDSPLSPHLDGLKLSALDIVVQGPPCYLENVYGFR